jgi:hypothetical protein
MERTFSKDLSGLKANVGLVVRGPVAVLRTFDTEVEAICARLGLKIAFKTASASKLWVKEGEPE